MFDFEFYCVLLSKKGLLHSKSVKFFFSQDINCLMFSEQLWSSKSIKDISGGLISYSCNTSPAFLTQYFLSASIKSESV